MVVPDPLAPDVLRLHRIERQSSFRHEKLLHWQQQHMLKQSSRKKGTPLISVLQAWLDALLLVGVALLTLREFTVLL